MIKSKLSFIVQIWEIEKKMALNCGKLLRDLKKASNIKKNTFQTNVKIF